MVAISGLIWLLVGTAISLYTLFVQNKAPDAKLWLFLAVGIVFIIIGIYKLVKQYILDDKTPAPSKPNITAHQAIRQADPETQRVLIEKQRIEQQLKRRMQQTQSILVCPACGTRHYSTSNFCHICGTKLK